ncbi:MAG: acyltransferase [Gammaproteobacteria bacterium]|nr:acyltransferase [Gammaproteobacteria bacterium]
MLARLFQTVRGVVSFALMVMYTLLCMVPLTLLAIGKLLSPTQKMRDLFRRLLSRVVEAWVGLNSRLVTVGRRGMWDIEVPAGLDRQGRYVVSCNHQSWVDILALQKVFNRRLPVLTFFIKKELIYVPFMGFAWWALDFPFMSRHSREEIRKNPQLAGKDLESARVACEKLKQIPSAMMSFPEGTRFSEAKRDRSGSPHRHLLKPKVGGIGVVMYALGDRLQSLIDVTIVYPSRAMHDQAPTFWDLMCGKVPEIIVRARELEIPRHLLGRNFRKDREIRRELEAWIHDVWQEKDQLITRLSPS